MSQTELITALQLIRENLGEQMADICEKLNSPCGMMVKEVIHELSHLYTGVQIKKSLITLMQHKYIRNVSTPNDEQYYQLDVSYVLKRIYQPLILEYLQINFSLYSAAILKLLFLYGSMPITNLIEETNSLFNGDETVYKNIIQDFVQLINIQAIGEFRLENISSSEPSFVPINFSAIQDIQVSTTAKRTYFNNETIYACANVTVLCELALEESMINYIKNLFDERAAIIFRVIFGCCRKKSFKQSDTLPSVTIDEIFNNLPTIPMLDIESLRSYITIFLDDSNSFLLSNKNYITPCYMIDNLKLLTKICEENICWVVSERYGIYSKRIYRLLLDKTYLEQKQVSDLSMVPFKETKEILYRMYSDLVVDCNQIIRTPDANPLSSLYLFTVNFNQSISVVLEFAKSVIGKIIDRRIAVMKDIRNLLHKNTKISSEYNIDDLCRSILKSVINNEKVVKYLNELELMELLKLHNSISQLDYSEINVSRVLLVLDKYNNVQINDKTIKK